MKSTVIQSVKNGRFSIGNSSLYFGIPDTSVINQWLNAFEKQGINRLLPKPKGHLSMKPTSPYNAAKT
ncbi:helix-turn-helix domain-containing protein [Rodentibacter rarus]|uniref:helix-turn-helix domain-containing protein n=1 Tax=Rodentibacter rarus TaxID=1908260 RepID=UPI00117B86F4|nr:helix-turn-helix domain-containing protein [Rodentibacter rarus]